MGTIKRSDKSVIILTNKIEELKRQEEESVSIEYKQVLELIIFHLEQVLEEVVR